MAPTSSQELRPSAATSPSGIPSATATAMLATASCAVLRMFSRSPSRPAPAADRRPEVAAQRVADEPRVLPRDRLVQVELRPHLGDLVGVVTNSASIIFTGSPGTRNSMLNTASVTPNSTGTTASARRPR